MAWFTAVPESTARLGVDPVFPSSGTGIEDVLVLTPNAGLRHIRRLNGQQVETNSLPSSGGIASPIAATNSAGGQIEVVAVAADHTLHHWRRINGNWLGPSTISGTIISAPMLADIGAGQLELLGVGGDQKLYRWRFTNRQWGNWTQFSSDLKLSATMFGQPAASSWGDGTLDLVVVEDHTGKMFYTRVMPPAASSTTLFPLTLGNLVPVFSEVDGRTIDTPVLEALSPTQLALFALGTDGLPYVNWAKTQPIPKSEVISLAGTVSKLREAGEGLRPWRQQPLS